MAAKRVRTITRQESANECTGENDGYSGTKRKRIDAEGLELLLPIGSDQDADEATKQKACYEPSTSGPAMGGSDRVILHEGRVAAARPSNGYGRPVVPECLVAGCQPSGLALETSRERHRQAEWRRDAA